MDADSPIEPETHSDDADFVAYLARRLRIESCEARARLSAWLSTYEPPKASGVRRAVPEPESAVELERSA